jgi:putative membrane protein
MKILSRALFLLFVLIGVLIAVSNAQRVDLTLWPLPYSVAMPLYLLVVALLLVGVLAGLGLGWWAGRHHRRRAREQASEAARLEREVARLRDTLATREAKLPAPGDPVPREQKAIERQSALVAPELVPPGRGPLVS